jgi:DNA polymerase III subunit epsilon
MDFVAIDFETANGQPSSACQLAAVVVRNSKIAEEHCWMIRPPRMYFAPINISVHGIRPDDVLKAPTMEQVWTSLSGIIDGQVLVAHNARFDMGVLIHSLAAFGIACPNIEFTCTRVLAKSAWPGKSGYGLKPLGKWLGIDFKHHDALEDSRCCAKIALTVAEAYSERKLESLEKTLRISRGHYRHGQIAGPRMLGRRSQGAGTSRTATDRWGFPNSRVARAVGAVDPAAVVTAAASELPLAGKHIVMLGPLRGLSIEETLQLISKLGAVAQRSITARTDFVIACGTTLDEASQVVCESLAVANAAPASEPKQAGIRLLSERQFLALLPAGKASVRW